MSPGGFHFDAQPLEAVYEADRRASFELPRNLSAPSEARRAVEELLLTGWYVQDQHLIDDVLLLISELVTNAVRHAAGQIVLRVALEADTIEISVQDGSDLLPSSPELLTGSTFREAGRGLMIVAALAVAWGIDEQPPAGKRVWARLARSTSG